jgi:CubicO group peptidase (beta-lactamase class C family)
MPQLDATTLQREQNSRCNVHNRLIWTHQHFHEGVLSRSRELLIKRFIDLLPTPKYHNRNWGFWTSRIFLMMSSRRSFRQKLKRIGGWISFAILLVAILLVLVFRPDRAAKAGAGLAAHNLCGAAFTSGLDPDAAFRESVIPLTGGWARFIRYRIDHPGRSVTASFAGVVHATAYFTEGYGCRLEYPENLPAPPPRSFSPAATADTFVPATVVVTTDPTIAAAIDRVFSEHPKEPTKNVKAVVVVKDDHLIAERYAPGYTIKTPLLSYSVAKSFTNALLGILVREGRLRVDQPVGAPEWAGQSDPRRRITVEHLLQMRSGLNAAETGTGFDPASQMLLTQSDMAGFAAQQELKVTPGTKWEYTSANTLILDRLLGDTVGGGAVGMREFAERELFTPLHMSDVTMEFDGRGVFVGSTYVYAPARAFARFGELFMQDGVSPDGRRILPQGWVSWSRHSTLGEQYGAGFWTNDGPSEGAVWYVKLGFPKDGFYASGIQGQSIYIVPSEHIVVARFGCSLPDRSGMQEEDDLALIDTVIHVTHRSQ